MRAIPTAAALALVGCAGSPRPVLPVSTADIQVFESPDAKQMTEGDTTLEVDPDVAYALLADYARWPDVFPDIHQAIVTAEDGPDARVTFVGAKDHRDNLHFHNLPAARTIWFEDTGGRAEVWAETTFAPGPRPGTTRVHSRLFADVHGLLSVVITDAKLRARRETKIASDLGSLRSYFAQDLARAAPHAATRTAANR